MPIVVAADDAEGWLLMEPLAGASDRAEGAAEALAPVWAAAQLASLAWLDELRAAGCPDRGLGPTLAAWRDVLAHDPEMALLPDDERAAVLGAADEVEARVREFWSTGLPDTLAHGDLHPGNVAYDGQDLRLFDWTDACISHPFLDGSHLAYFVASDDADADPSSSPPSPSRGGRRTPRQTSTAPWPWRRSPTSSSRPSPSRRSRPPPRTVRATSPGPWPSW